jgi:diguanylate cyclase (GGDEF)-like protein/PAS domain S-box-containing protein
LLEWPHLLVKVSTVIKATVTAEKTDSGAQPVIRSHGVTVLVITEVEADADAVRLLLREQPDTGQCVVVADSLYRGLARLDRGGIDVVIVDLRLPDSSGLSTLQRLRGHVPAVPVIVLVDPGGLELGRRAMRHGAQSFLVKDELDGRLLRATVATALIHHQVLNELWQREDRLSRALQGSQDGVWDWDVAKDEVYYSPRWNGMLGYPESELTASPDHWFRLVHPDDLPHLKRVLKSHLDGDTRRFEHEHRILGAEGEYLWVLTKGLALGHFEGGSVRVAGTQTDITARKLAEQQALHHALHDDLTGLPNRALLVDRLALSLAQLRRDPQAQFALLYLDLDRFKDVNDRFGHGVGDRLLDSVARRLERLLRPGDTVARLSGDEFAALLKGAKTVADAVHVAERVGDAVNEPYEIEGRHITVSASIGIALSSSGYRNPEEILHDADVAMYRSKTIGRARCQVFDPKMQESANALLRMESELRGAVANMEFVLHYQPIVALSSGQVVGFEALIRWRHPDRGLIPPRQFLGIAEETGLIVPIGWWVLRESCRQLRRWLDAFPQERELWISTNVSGKLFMQVGMVDRLLEILESEGVRPENLRLELSENVALEHGDAALARFAELRALGLRLSVDDFGTGFSSLSHLERFRYDDLKIDHSFVNRIDDGGEPLVKTMLALASSLGIGVIAEGVETEDQARLLWAMDCPQGQGYWFARPGDAESAAMLITAAPEWWKLRH